MPQEPQEPPEPVCPDCGKPLREPDDAEKGEFEDFLERPTEDSLGRVDKTFKDLLRNLVTDMQIGDDWFWEVIPTKGGKPSSIYPLPGEYIRLIVRGKEKKFCPNCIRQQVEESPNAYPSAVYFVGLDETNCPVCKEGGLKIAKYVQVDDARNVIAAWADDEILHGNTRAFGSRRYGVPKTLSVFFTVQTLYYQEQYQLNRYSQRKMPEGVLSFPGLSQQAVQQNFESLAEWWTVNRHAPKYLILGAQETPAWLDLGLKMVDLEAKEMALYYREAIAITYGVSLQMLGIQTPGKLGNEQEQVSVSFDTIEEVQQQVEEFINTKLLPLFPEVEDWEFVLKPPEKDDLVRKIQVQTSVVQLYQTLKGLGAKVTLSKDMTEVRMDQPPPDNQSPQDLANQMMQEQLGAAQPGDVINLPFGQKPGGKPKEPQSVDGGNAPAKAER